MRTSAQIRQDFLDFFAGKQHVIVPSAPVIPHGDPTLLFTNAGMNQFKDVFLGQGERAYTRAADTQRCIRVSGKHNDLEEVGRDGYHHTFFEMLGNWSFGDYYKRESIAWAWELLTKVWQLPKDRLFATVYEDDAEAFELWAAVTDIGRDRILRFGAKDNFWEMGEAGPCGPCSEIHYDRTPDGSGRDLVNAGVPEVMEIWNLVFIQYDRQADGSLEDLPNTHIDTGMGFERIVSVLQNTDSNYDTDVFRPLIDAIADVTGVAYAPGDGGVPHQVIADHIRMLTMAIGDGALPSNLGRGYVLRRVLRRAARFGRKLDAHDPFLYRLVPAVIDIYRDIFPDIAAQGTHVQRVVEAEEKSFNRTLDRGIQLFEQAVANLQPGDEIAGAVVFRLYDTYGFPADMTQQMAEERGLSTDEAGFERELAQQKERSRASANFHAAAAEDGAWTVLVDTGAPEFVGYDATAAEAQVTRLRVIEETDAGARVQVVLDRTPFYGESGGQVGDTGIIDGEGFRIRITDTQKVDNETVHIGILEAGAIDAGPVTATVDVDRRHAIRRNHTATHLLHRALRHTLGDHVQQKGSLVSEERLRFDFSHYEGLATDELQQVEEEINAVIRANLELDISYAALAEAKAAGATALFGENYGDTVRVVRIADYSMELCGGTHCRATGEIALCKLVSEGSISAGIRRIEAVTGAAALAAFRDKDRLLRLAGETLRCREAEVPERVAALQQRLKELQRENAELNAAAAAAKADALLSTATAVAGVTVLAAAVDVPDLDALKAMGGRSRDKLGSAVIVLGAAIQGKAMFIALVSPDLVERDLHAGKIIRPVARITGGGGGGQPYMAQAGGRQPEKIAEAIAAVPDVIRRILA